MLTEKLRQRLSYLDGERTSFLGCAAIRMRLAKPRKFKKRVFRIYAPVGSNRHVNLTCRKVFQKEGYKLWQLADGRFLFTALYGTGVKTVFFTTDDIKSNFEFAERIQTELGNSFQIQSLLHKMGIFIVGTRWCPQDGDLTQP